MTALFLKYRPQTFQDLVGQATVKKTLKNALSLEKPAHAYLFAGSRGTGKTSTARIFAKGLNCTDLQDGDPCGKCAFCVDTMNGSLIDVIEIDAASNRGIDEIRDLREKITFMPNVAKRKVYIIDEVHMLTKEAFNALLKTLEEPPDHAYFCLATTEIHKLPETIVSRCQTFIFERFALEALIDRLEYIAKEEGIVIEQEALCLIAEKSEGGMRDAISLLEQLSAETENKITESAVRSSLGISSTALLIEFYEALLAGETESTLGILKTVSKTGGDFRTFGHDFLSFLRGKMIENLENTLILQRILNLIDLIEKALFRLKTSPIVELPLEIAVIKATLEDTPSTTTAKPVVESLPVAPITPKMPKEIIPQTSDEKPQIEAVKEKEVETSFEFTAEGITRQMEAILKTSQVPVFVKKSFLTTIPKVVGMKVTFYTDSEFHREKLAKAEVINKIQSAINDLFDVQSTIEFLKKGNSTFKKKIVEPESETATADDFLNF